MKITIDTHNCSREELAELKEYLEAQSWDFKTDEPEPEAKYILSENGILIVGSHGITLNEKIRNEELHEYYILERTEFLDTLIGWIGEAEGSNKAMMKDDLEELMTWEDDYIFSSVSTNAYIRQGDSEFDETCKQLIELNETL